MRYSRLACRWLATAVVAAGCLASILAKPARAQDGAVPGHGHRAGNCRMVNGQLECKPYVYGQPNLFQNYYVNPACSPLGAQMYISPGPVPAHVGHTYITYQPLEPHEFMYPHHRTYHRYYDEGRGVTRAHVHWYQPPGKCTLSHLHHMLKIPR